MCLNDARGYRTTSGGDCEGVPGAGTADHERHCPENQDQQFLHRVRGLADHTTAAVGRIGGEHQEMDATRPESDG